MVKNLPANAGDANRFCPWARKMPWRRKWQPTPVFLPEESRGQRSLAGYIVHGFSRVRDDLVTNPPGKIYTKHRDERLLSAE